MRSFIIVSLRQLGDERRLRCRLEWMHSRAQRFSQKRSGTSHSAEPFAKRPLCGFPLLRSFLSLMEWRSPHASVQTDFRGRQKMVRMDVRLNWLAHRPAFLNAAHRILHNPAP